MFGNRVWAPEGAITLGDWYRGSHVRGNMFFRERRRGGGEGEKVGGRGRRKEEGGRRKKEGSYLAEIMA